LNDTLDLVDAGNRNVVTPIAVAPRDRACDASARQLIEGARRKHQRRASSSLLVGDGLEKIEPNDISGFRAPGVRLRKSPKQKR
jgi:hypothetical protein